MNAPRSLAALLLALALAASACGRTDAPAAPPGSSGFDAWAEGFAEEWVRASPQMATRAQYFTGAEQAALDRQLSMIGEWDSAFGSKAMALRAAQARRGLDASVVLMRHPSRRPSARRPSSSDGRSKT